MWAVGLRGAVAYGLAVNLPQINEESNQGIQSIESATLVIVVISTIVFGGLTGVHVCLIIISDVITAWVGHVVKQRQAVTINIFSFIH